MAVVVTTAKLKVRVYRCISVQADAVLRAVPLDMFLPSGSLLVVKDMLVHPWLWANDDSGCGFGSSGLGFN